MGWVEGEDKVREGLDVGGGKELFNRGGGFGGYALFTVIFTVKDLA